MTLFIFAAASITLCVLFVLLWPLLKTADITPHARQLQNIHYAKDRLQELEQQLLNKRISTADFATLKLEIESTLAQDIDLNETHQRDSSPDIETNNRVLISLVFCSIPLAALVLYQITGTPAALQVSQLNQIATRSDPANPPSRQEIDSMIGSLQQRLQDVPDDLEGWTVLARTYHALGRYPESIQANKRRLELGGEDADTYAALADASALEAGGALSGLPSDYVRRALKINPRHPQALWLAGLSAAQTGDSVLARNYWQQLLPLLEDVPKQKQELQDIINQTFDQSTLEEQQTTGDATDNAGNIITIRVHLAASLADLVGREDTVFVFAKAFDGPPMPLAAKRLRAADLPAEIQLSDADAMLAAFKLSDFEDLQVSARLSKSGKPAAQAGDIQSASIRTSNDNENIIELELSVVLE